MTCIAKVYFIYHKNMFFISFLYGSFMVPSSCYTTAVSFSWLIGTCFMLNVMFVLNKYKYKYKYK